MKKITISASTDQATWQASTAYSKGAIVKPTTANGYYYICTTAGTSGSSQPTWPTTVGATVNDNTVVWECDNRYPVLLAIGESSGASNYNFHLEGRSASFPSSKDQSGDLRFTTGDGSTSLDFWVESVSGTSPNRTAFIWVETLGDLSAKDIYCYFGNSGASNASNGNNTFPFFDDFPGSTLDTNKWQGDTGYYSVANSICSISTSADRNITGTISLNFPLAVRAYAKFPSNKYNGFEGANSYITMFMGGPSSSSIRTDDASGNHTFISNWTRDQYRTFEIRFRNTALNFLDNNTEVQNSPITSYIFVEAKYARIYAGNPGESYVDWILLRRFVSPEPAFSSAGALETFNFGAMLLMFLS